MNASLQRRLSIWLSISILFAGLLAAAASFLVAYHDATEAQDTQLVQIAAALSMRSFTQPVAMSHPEDSDEIESRFFVRPLGGPEAAADSGADFVFPRHLGLGLQTFTRDGVQWRAMVSKDSEGRRFGVAQSIAARDEEARDGALFILIPLGLLIPVLMLSVHVILRRAFAPLAALSIAVDRVDGANLAELGASQVPREILPFVEAVNRLLRRLRLAFEQQRRLVSDAAHELRSPVAALMVQAENVRSVELSTEARERVDALSKGLLRISGLLEQLLSFARVQGVGNDPHRIVELHDVVRATIEELLPMAQAKDIDLGCVRIEATRILGDPVHATSLVRNAIDNAIRYTPPGGSVDVTVAREAAAACFIVEDSGPGIADEHVERVFEPFFRVLGNQQTGSGLGLAIAQTAAGAMGGIIELAPREDGKSGLRFVYRQAAV